MKNIKHYKGTTLIEVLIYTGLTASLLLAIAIVFGLSTRSQQENQAKLEVTQQAAFISRTIEDEIRDSDGIVQPLISTNGSTLELSIFNVNKNSIFTLNNGILELKEENNQIIPLSTDDVVIQSIDFQNNSDIAGLSKTVSYTFTISYKNLDNIKEEDYIRTYYGTVTLRN